MMHKEVVARKRTHVIIITLLLITCMLYLYEGIEALKIKNILLLQVCNALVILFTLTFILREYFSCRIAYKYSIIADKLIINKVYKTKEKNLESIKIDNIVYIGKKSRIPKEYNVKCIGRYTCDVFRNDSLCCVYKKNNNLVKFNFEPSEDLIRRIGKCNKSLNIE